MVKPEIEIIPTALPHIRWLSENLRPEDEQEILCVGFSTTKALYRSFKSSIFPRTALIDGEIAAIWGTGGSALGTTGQPWLLTSEVVKKISPLQFCRIYQVEVLKMLKIFPLLVNYVDSRYTAAIRLLDIVGFQIDEPQAIAEGGPLFRRFEKRAS